MMVGAIIERTQTVALSREYRCSMHLKLSVGSECELKIRKPVLYPAELRDRRVRSIA
jgi:hypothetical protein